MDEARLAMRVKDIKELNNLALTDYCHDLKQLHAACRMEIAERLQKKYPELGDSVNNIPPTIKVILLMRDERVR